MNDTPIITCSNLTHKYGSFVALNQINLTIKRKRIIGLLGPNGSGKTTLIKLLNGLILPSDGDILIDGTKPGIHSKEIISYLPDHSYFANWMKVKDLFSIFEDFYKNFDSEKAVAMCGSLGIKGSDRIKEMSRGTKEKVQLILAMSRKADLYLLDEPIAGVDPATRDYILSTIINNYNEEGTVIISTHLIADIEQVLDEVIFIQNGHAILYDSVDNIREREGKSVDELFREMFRMGGSF